MRHEDIVICRYCKGAVKANAVIDDHGEGVMCLDCAVEQYPATYPSRDAARLLSLLNEPEVEETLTEWDLQILIFYYYMGEILKALQQRGLPYTWLEAFLQARGVGDLEPDNILEAHALLYEYFKAQEEASDVGR